MMFILICSTTYGGCGFIGSGQYDFDSDGDTVICHSCGEDHAFQVTEENMVSLTNEHNRELARLLITNDKSVVSKADCGCVYHAKDAVVCWHDIALARKKHFNICL